MKHLNDIKGFLGVLFMSQDKDYCKVEIMSRDGTEKFWISDLEREGGTYKGIVDNDLILEKSHGLQYGDKVSFELIK